MDGFGVVFEGVEIEVEYVDVGVGSGFEYEIGGVGNGV